MARVASSIILDIYCCFLKVEPCVRAASAGKRPRGSCGQHGSFCCVHGPSSIPKRAPGFLIQAHDVTHHAGSVHFDSATACAEPPATALPQLQWFPWSIPASVMLVLVLLSMLRVLLCALALAE